MAGLRVEGEDLKSKDWFRVDATRESAEAHLKNQGIGTFVVRPSSRKDCYALSYKTRDGTIAHSLVQKNALGYKLPDEDTVYPTLVALLKACKFLTGLNGSDQMFKIDDKAMAMLIEAFPDATHESIVKALTKTNNDVTRAIDILLGQEAPPFAVQSAHSRQTLQQQQPQPQPQPQPQSPPRNPPSQPPFHQPQSQQPQPQPQQSISIANTFVKLTRNKVRKEDVVVGWSALGRAPETGPGISASMYQNLVTILQNVSHPMGKKVNFFVVAFNTNFQGNINAQNAAEKCSKANQEVKSFIAGMQTSIVAKVTELSNNIGMHLVWKAVEMIVMDGIYANLLQLFRNTYVVQDSVIDEIMHRMANATLQQLGAASKFINKELNPFSKAIETLKTLTSIRTETEKLNCLVQTCQAILEYTRAAYHGSVVTSDDLLPLFTYILCKSQLPYVRSELALMKDYITEPLATVLDGFALATFETCINFLESSHGLSSNGSNNSRTKRGNSIDDLFSNAPMPTLPPPLYPQPPVGAGGTFGTVPTTDPFAPPPFNPQLASSPPAAFYPASNNHIPANPEPYRVQHYPQQQQQSFDDFNPRANELSPPSISPLPFYNPEVIDVNYVSKSARPLSSFFNAQAIHLPPNTSEEEKFNTLKRAEKAYIVTLKSMPDSPGKHNQLAMYYNSKGKPSKAIFHCNQALALDPQNEEAQQNFKLFSQKLTNQLNDVINM